MRAVRWSGWLGGLVALVLTVLVASPGHAQVPDYGSLLGGGEEQNEPQRSTPRRSTPQTGT